MTRSLSLTREELWELSITLFFWGTTLGNLVGLTLRDLDISLMGEKEEALVHFLELCKENQLPLAILASAARKMFTSLLDPEQGEVWIREILKNFYDALRITPGEVESTLLASLYAKAERKPSLIGLASGFTVN